ncbi:TPM domain-containing protein [Sporosarcina sp. GW1-11]|uniref:TPM domain-containing protein n=1 Tax=Sporosarcina sp. GW1-11 TaxID=2899126 RepID=UPI00294C375C|nr:TPM domain-containing protein [Sporosarcina sp. GW1-11]MDV6378425.1 TPM domain-containing protein [Sporosarcina sp. GW1-11]
MFVAVLLIALIGTATPAHAVSEVVVDDAEILSPQQEAELKDYGLRLQQATKAEFAVRTVYSLEGVPVEEYAVRKLRELKLGDAKMNNGALLIVSTEKDEAIGINREFYLTTGYGLEGALPDGKIGRIIDEVAMPYLRNEQPDLAIMEAYKAFYNEIAAEYGLEGDVLPVVYAESQEEPGIPSFVVVLIVIFLLYRMFKGGGGRGGGPGGRSRGGPIFFPGSMGGGSGGGFSGGGGGFGGGGSGGGGGAGRSW